MCYLLDRKTKSFESNERDGSKGNWILCLKAYNDTAEAISNSLETSFNGRRQCWSFGQTIAQPRIIECYIRIVHIARIELQFFYAERISKL